MWPAHLIIPASNAPNVTRSAALGGPLALQMNLNGNSPPQVVANGIRHLG